MDGNRGSMGDRAESTAYESPSVCSRLTHSQGSQCLGDVMSSLGEEFQPHVASEELVPVGNAQLLDVKNPRQKKDGALNPCMCVCVCVCACAVKAAAGLLWDLVYLSSMLCPPKLV